MDDAREGHCAQRSARHAALGCFENDVGMTTTGGVANQRDRGTSFRIRYHSFGILPGQGLSKNLYLTRVGEGASMPPAQALLKLLPLPLLVLTHTHFCYWCRHAWFVATHRNRAGPCQRRHAGTHRSNIQEDAGVALKRHCWYRRARRTRETR